MTNGDLHAREREDLALHVERCAERYGAVQAELGSLRQQVRRIEAALWGIAALLLIWFARIAPRARAAGERPVLSPHRQGACSAASDAVDTHRVVMKQGGALRGREAGRETASAGPA